MRALDPSKYRAKRKAATFSDLLAYILLITLALGVGYLELSKRERITSQRVDVKTAPPVGVGSENSRLGIPQPQTYSQSYKFTNMNSKGSAPISWDPCRAIHYVINPNNQPLNGQEMIKYAISEISYYSGFKFIFDGETDEEFSETRKGYQPEKYGEKWAPVLFTWSTPTTHPGLTKEILGEGGASILNRSGDTSIYVTGMVDLETIALDEYMSSKGDNSKVIAVILHELGHVMGLDHSEGPWEIMYPEANMQVTKLGLGDKSGLSILGSQPCHPEL